MGSIARAELVAYLDAELEIEAFADYGPQGLQVEGRERVERIVATVDAGLPCVEAAIADRADLLLVHHGIFWGPARRLAGGYGRLVRRLVESELNLYAAHLALDAHPEWGNNAELCRLLGVEIESWWGQAKGRPIGAMGSLPEGPVDIHQLVARLETAIGPSAMVQSYGPAKIERVAVMSGGGAGYVAEAAALGCQAYITGETSQSHYYEAQVAGIHVVYAGHYASETVGVRALGLHLAERFGLEFAFVDLPTGI
jgi:dinuclear metal center YbgI/SA1388 family protein